MDTITNKSGIQYSYKIDPAGTALNKTVDSNAVVTNLVLGKLQMTESADKTYATIGDTITYTINISNGGNILLSNIILKNAIPTGSKFVDGSVKIDEVAQPSANIATGVNLGSMIIAGTKKVSFQILVESLPTPNTIISKATSAFDYLVLGVVTGNSESNTVTTTVHVTSLTVVKSANVNAVEAGDEITYTIVITNTGNIDVTNITFTDVLDAQLQFVTGSATINGTSQAAYDPNTGFSLPTIVPNASSTVIFKATVIE